MKTRLALACIGSLLFMASAHAQDSAAPQTRPDARYPRPSGQDANPGQTVVKPTTPAPPSSHPEAPRTATTGGADKQAYQEGKKPDDSAGCTNPTDAASAGVAPDDSAARKRADGKKTVCTTAGAERVGAKDKADPSKTSKSTAKEAKAPSTSTSATPR
jgi:hypothetical protein